MQVETRRSLVVLFLTVLVFVGLGTVWVYHQHRSADQFGVGHVHQVPSELTDYPAYVASTIVDRNGAARIVMLQKLTVPLDSEDPPPFHWVDLIAIDPNGKRLECIVDGEPVRIDRGVQVFYASDSGRPQKRWVDQADLNPIAPPRAKWDLLVPASTTEKSR